MCLFVRTVKNKRYTKTKKNGGNVPECPDERLKSIPAKCGKCIECKKEYARNWQVRLSHELRKHEGPIRFMTMTFSDEAIKKLNAKHEWGDNDMAKKAVEKFLDRWKHKYKKAPKHWLITERGQKGSERIHIHGFIWTELDAEEIEKLWKYGWVDTGLYVNEKSIAYCVKYVYKHDSKHLDFKPKIFATKGLGKGIADMQDYQYRGEKTNTSYRLENGGKIPMPSYTKRKIWTDEEREYLRLKQLDEKILYVGGIKCDISTEQGKRLYIKRLKLRINECEKMGFNTGIEFDKKECKKTLELFDKMSESTYL